MPGEFPITLPLSRIAERETRAKALDCELAELQIGPVDELDTRRLRRAVEERIGRFRAPLRADVPLPRQALGRLIVPDSLRFTPTTVSRCRTFDFEGKTRIGPLFDQRYIRNGALKGICSPR